MSLRVAPLDSWLRVVRTARHLRASQIAWRLRRVLAGKLPNRHKFQSTVTTDAESLCRTIDAFSNMPEFSRGCLSGGKLVVELERGELTLVNETKAFDIRSPDWRLGHQLEDRLWAITLHYHAWLYELSKLGKEDPILASKAHSMLQDVLRSWLDACQMGQPGVADLAWNSYAVATRIGWWVRLWFSLAESFWKHETELKHRFLNCLYQQAQYLAENIEWDLRANHLLRDAVGLAWAGQFFWGPAATRWQRLATRIALSQADEQMLADGGHFERSPFYHLEVMDDWMALATLLSKESVRERMWQTWELAAEYARWLAHPDGRVAQFNDGAAVEVEPHLSFGRRISPQTDAGEPKGGRWFEHSGVVAWHGDPWTVFWDVGEVGPRYQPGHAHADTLTLEASYRGIRLFVDPGCHSYDNNSIRFYDRATASHNTVCIDQEDSSEVWHIFRVGRRARPRDVSVTFEELGLHARASHTGYDHLPGRPAHTRLLDVRANGELSIVDQFVGKGVHTAEGGFLLEPTWDVQSAENGWHLVREGVKVKVQIEADRPLSLVTESRPYHPDYGVELETQRLIWRCSGPFPLTVRVSVMSA
ncbi:MAG: alginate lyase family protein [Planctomycetaceae bacterium]|nr:alginate lyase family protein [Planctomycetales bacterium]MCB9920677.1 alginate lyase family protein [Planctomycetaceae bacterium]